MKEMELKSVLKRKFVVTIDSNHVFSMAKNVLNRDFGSFQIGEKWISDITYIRVNDNWDYLTTIIDLADRKLLSWTLSEDMTAQNTIIKAWYLARNKRQIKDGFIFHSDRGVQYASNKITNLFSLNNKIYE
jgi:putative transposase